jgi:hypothetical protein
MSLLNFLGEFLECFGKVDACHSGQTLHPRRTVTLRYSSLHAILLRLARLDLVFPGQSCRSFASRTTMYSALGSGVPNTPAFRCLRLHRLCEIYPTLCTTIDCFSQNEAARAQEGVGGLESLTDSIRTWLTIKGTANSE